MNIAVIAASGRSGKAFVEQALADGHHVRAGVYHTNTLQSHPLLTVVECDANNKEDILNLINGQDAVVSFIGHVKNSPTHVQTDMVRVVNEAMTAKGIKRFVTLTGTGVRFPGDKITLIDRILNTAIGIIDPKRIQDGKDHVALLQTTNLEWTVIRVLKLSNSNASPYSLRSNGPAKVLVSRQEVASAVLEVLTGMQFIMQAPIISPAAQH